MYVMWLRQHKNPETNIFILISAGILKRLVGGKEFISYPKNFDHKFFHQF